MAKDRGTRQRTGTVEPFTRADGTVYYRGKIRLGDGSRHRIDVDEPFCFDKDEAQKFTATIQAEEDAHGRILAAKLGKPIALSCGDREPMGGPLANVADDSRAIEHAP